MMDLTVIIDAIYIPKKLQRPDRFGNYWLANERDSKPHCPVIFRHTQEKIRSHDGATYNKVSFWCSGGGDIGIIWKGRDIKYFDTPEEALEALRQLVSTSRHS